MSDDQQVQALLAAVPVSFAPFSADEIAELRLYHSLVEELDRRKLANQRKLIYDIDAGGTMTTDVDEDDVLALATTLRKLAWAQKDGGTFNRITNRLCRRARQLGTPEGSSMLGRIKAIKELRDAAEQQSRVAAYGTEQDDGSTKEYTPEMLCDLAVNGSIFHSDPDLRAEWERLGGFKNPAVHMILITTFKDFTQFFRAVDLIVNEVLATPALVAASP
jgi:hypothetical protein